LLTTWAPCFTILQPLVHRAPQVPILHAITIMDGAILAASNKHPKPADETFQYGTAGFRMKATLLDSVVFRVGMFWIEK
jgi:hypothetical protein